MGRYYFRPTSSVVFGEYFQYGGAANKLGDNSTSTGYQFNEAAGAVCVYPAFNPANIPAGKDVIAVRVGHKHWQDYGDGWAASYLRINNNRVPTSYCYTQDGVSSTSRDVLGPALYKTAGAGGWSTAELSTMASDVGAAVGEIGPNTKKRTCSVDESFIVVIYSEDVPVPVASYPAASQSIATSSVNFSAVLPPVQSEQPVQAVFQVARNNTFTDDVRTYIGALNTDTTAGSKSTYTSTRTDNTYTNLGPGGWYLRIKGRDYTGTRESAWSSTISFTVSHSALPATQFVAPVQDATVASPYTVRTVQILADPSGDRRVGAEFSFSPVSDFSSGVVSWQNRNGLFIAGNISYSPQPNPSTLPGQYSDTVSPEDPSQYLTQGLWYARSRAVDSYGQTGAWSSTISFTVQHQPYADDYYPKQGQAFDQYQTPVKWSFKDPWADDMQSAYQLVVTDLSSNVLQDTGKVTSALHAVTMNIGNTHLQEALHYTVKLWDLDNVVSVVNPTQNFFMSVAPVTTLSFPAESQGIATGQPTLNWSNTFSRGGVTQKSYRVDILQANNQVTVHTSGTITSSATTYSPPKPVLKNLFNYQIKLTITDSDDLSSVLTRNFSTNFDQPAQAQSTVNTEDYYKNGYAFIEWYGDPDPFFAFWRIYRQKVDNGGTALDDWELAGEVSDIDARSFNDWLISGTSLYHYSVNQVSYRFGSLVESPYEEYGEIVSIVSQDYWLIVEGHPELNVHLFKITADKYTDEIEQSSFFIIGRGRHVNYGTALGMNGSLSVQVRGGSGITATQQIKNLRAMYQQRRNVLMKDPFGNITQIAIGDLSVDRVAGVGNSEYANIEMPYLEVK